MSALNDDVTFFRFLLNSTERRDIFYIFYTNGVVSKRINFRMEIEPRSDLEFRGNREVSVQNQIQIKNVSKRKSFAPIFETVFFFFCWLGFNTRIQYFLSKFYAIYRNTIQRNFLKRIICENTYNWAIVLYRKTKWD